MVLVASRRCPLRRQHVVIPVLLDGVHAIGRVAHVPRNIPAPDHEPSMFQRGRRVGDRVVADDVAVGGVSSPSPAKTTPPWLPSMMLCSTSVPSAFV